LILNLISNMISIFQVFILSLFLIQTNQSSTISLFHGSRKVNKIALTFDACPSSTHGGYDDQVVRTLVDSNVSATFFLSGRWILKHKLETKHLSSIPFFEIGNHSYNHPHCLNIQDDSIRKELQLTEKVLTNITGISLKLFRPPFGEIDARIECIAQELGFNTIMFDVASGDPDSTITKGRLVKYVCTRAKNGSIIIMHVNGRGWHTAEALPEIIQALRKKGFVFVKVSDLLRR
jgi:peptidoglycan-N-acetylglucosamine deacetylase